METLMEVVTDLNVLAVHSKLLNRLFTVSLNSLTDLTLLSGTLRAFLLLFPLACLGFIAIALDIPSSIQ